MREVLDALRAAIARGAFEDELGKRIHQLGANMVDGRVIPREEADALREAMLAMTRDEALPAIASRSPRKALGVLDKLRAYGWTQLESNRVALEAARAERFPPPAPPAWPELDELRAAGATIAPPVRSADFVEAIALPLPDEIVSLYGWADGFDCADPAGHPAFALLPSMSIDVSDEEGEYPTRPVVFQGHDEVQLSVFRSGNAWRLVFEHEFAPVADKALDVRELLRFALRCMRDTSPDASWDGYFDVRR